MEFIWLASSSPRFSEFRTSAGVLRIVQSPTDLPRAVAHGTARALIVEISGPTDRDSSFSAVDRWQKSMPVWILDPGATVSDSVQWMKAGVSHVATSIEEIEVMMRNCAASPEPHRSTGERPGGRSGQSMIGGSRAAAELADRIALVADRRCNVLIEGETGTGKEVAARAIHASGSRARGPWIAVNCGAIPETLLEAELFGYVKGAFTGAVQSRPGKFEAAHRGTIFLDEIGDMPLAVQGKLLRVLQEREVERLGGNECIRLDVRVIAATNSRLAECVRNGTFRQDLYYRLNVFSLSLTPLRERMDDIAPLAEHFVAKICAAEHIPHKTLDASTLRKLMCHSWPGNIRELENTIESAVISSGARASIFPSDVSWTHDASCRGPVDENSAPVLPPDGIDFERVLEEFEKNILAQALSRTRGNKTAAAGLLGLKRTTLAARMRALESRMPRLVA